MIRLPVDFTDRLRDLFSTVDLTRLLMRAGGDDTRMERLVRLAVDIARADAGMLVLVDEDRGDLLVAAAVGPGAGTIAGTHLPPSAGVVGTAVAGGEPIAVADAGETPADDEIARRTGLAARNILAVPFDVHGVAAGALEVRNTSAPRGFDQETIARLGELARLAAAAVEDYRGDRFLLSLFAAALPHALAAGDGDAARANLTGEVRRWIDGMRQTPAYRGALRLVEPVRELLESGEEGLRLAADILEILARRERARRERTRAGRRPPRSPDRPFRRGASSSVGARGGRDRRRDRGSRA